MRLILVMIMTLQLTGPVWAGTRRPVVEPGTLIVHGYPSAPGFCSAHLELLTVVEVAGGEIVSRVASGLSARDCVDIPNRRAAWAYAVHCPLRSLPSGMSRRSSVGAVTGDGTEVCN